MLGHFATGVTIVTARDGGGAPCGLTANAFTSVSLDPPLVLVCIDRRSRTRACVLAAQAFAVNVLAAEQEAWARRFAARTGDRFAGLRLTAARTGAPILDGVLAWLDCVVERTVEIGDHTVVVGHVLAGHAREGAPLVFFRGRYGTLHE